MTANRIDENDEQRLSARQQASTVERAALRQLAQIHAAERRQLEATLSQFRANMLRWRTDSIETEMRAGIEDSIRSAIRKAGTGDVMMQYRATIEGMLSHGSLAQMRDQARRGELPFMVIANAPKAGEKAPKAPVLLILDISSKLGWQEG